MKWMGFGEIWSLVAEFELNDIVFSYVVMPKGDAGPDRPSNQDKYVRRLSGGYTKRPWQVLLGSGSHNRGLMTLICLRVL